MSRIYYHTGDDVKLRLQFKVDGSVVDPKLVPFMLRVWTTNKLDWIEAGWNGTTSYGGLTFDGNYVRVAADANPKWWSGDMHAEVTMYYPDAEMPDQTYARIYPIELTEDSEEESPEVVVTGTVSHEVFGRDASVKTSSFDSEGNTVIEWMDGKFTTIKRGIKGEDGQDGVDGDVMWPAVGINEQGEMYIEVEEGDSTNLSIDEDSGYLCMDMPEL